MIGQMFGPSLLPSLSNTNSHVTVLQNGRAGTHTCTSARIGLYRIILRELNEPSPNTLF